MSYTISISGHVDAASDEEARAFEEDVAAKARALVAQLEGVNAATAGFGMIGPQDLQAAS